ncbi:DNA-binding XRE family transcriptional regulator [Alkalibacillus filiformis]|uniref:DNA-binding XRE family transcriptional regulator n=1 Tax=Alkalibacillus filiformis TaxID=200990 RepID=A0ABU0DVI4_9BACI|nr:helix-turn-helix transcriptional regulator [Alkalibacillus filiformis]MDQ0352469.1 DNA-binding XRE family transcriptional regulator [Alkalibacillus filiformis]
MKVAVKNFKFLESIIIKKGYSKTGLAEKAGIHHMTMWNVFNGKSNPSPSTALKICKALDVEFDDVFQIVDQEEVTTK